MAADFYTDAALTLTSDFLDLFGNPLSADDLPFQDRRFFGDPDSGINIVDGVAPGSANCTIQIEHLVAERVNGEPIALDDERRSETNNGYIYKALNAGTADVAPPVWPTTIGATVVDNDVTWQCVRRTLEPANMKLATTSGGLAAATPGAALDLGVTAIPSLAINAVEIWAEIDTAVTLVNSVELYMSADHLVLEAA